MKKVLFSCYFLFVCLALASCDDKENEGPASSLTIRSITPAAGSIVSRSTVIEAQLEYTVADRDTSTASTYHLYMLITCKDEEGKTVFISKEGKILNNKKGLTTITYALTDGWDSAAPTYPLAQPITCYFSLGTIKDGVAYPIAETQKVTFAE